MVDATIDSYGQMRVFLSEDNLNVLEETGQVEGRIWRTTGDTLPLWIYAKEGRWRAEGLPQDKFYEEKELYEVDIPINGLSRIRQREVIGAEFVGIRKVYISLEGVW